ncbi:uncharacterized protein LOC128506584 isoform X2 [Clarias gariepinus]|uniref:uncharacterized protein LOC128506584 isoform X2 n=1 Tax=Clarias gariepinus TaxID=13013 RepID=UPI00234D044B|nr:uncharacterized protein LOC128506584 isoform X2 [Clarias gariepinus]
MNTLLIIIIITFYLISGPVHCSDVIGYPGGRLIIYYKHSVSFRSSVYFCRRKTQTECKDLIVARGEQLHTGVHQDRFTLFTFEEVIILIFRNLSLQDTGVYQGGETGVWSQNFNLKVNRDPCCSQRKTVKGYLGRTVRISCSYPVVFAKSMKFLYKLNRLSETEVIRTRGSEQHQDARFSISDDTRNKEFSVNISDVGEDDGGVYSCAVSNEETEVIYHSLFTGIQLQVTEGTEDTTENPGGRSESAETGSSIIISVLVCVILLLGAGLVLMIYKQRRSKSQGCLDANEIERLSEIACSEKTEDSEATVYYSIIPLSSHLSDPLNTVYATAELPTIPSDPPNNAYATAELPTIPSDPPNNVYATAELPTIHNVYATVSKMHR